MTFKQVFPNPYDPSIPNFQPETLQLDEIIRQAIQAQMISMRVCLPASITEVLGNQKVSVQPLLQARYTNQTVVNIPVIQNVMVSMPMGANYSIKLPIAVGDTGWLIFCDRSLDNWAASQGGIIDPQDSRMHDISDPIFVPGLVPFANQTTDTTTDLVFNNGMAQIRLLATGLLKFTNGDTTLNTLLQQLVSNIQELVTNVKSLVSNTNDLVSATENITVLCASPGSPSGPPINVADIAAVASELSSTNSDLSSTNSDLSTTGTDIGKLLV